MNPEKGTFNRLRFPKIMNIHVILLEVLKKINGTEMGGSNGYVATSNR